MTRGRAYDDVPTIIRVQPTEYPGRWSHLVTLDCFEYLAYLLNNVVLFCAAERLELVSQRLARYELHENPYAVAVGI